MEYNPVTLCYCIHLSLATCGFGCLQCGQWLTLPDSSGLDKYFPTVRKSQRTWNTESVINRGGSEHSSRPRTEGCSVFTCQVREQKGLLETLGCLGCDLGYKVGVGRQWLPAWVPRVAGWWGRCLGG